MALPIMKRIASWFKARDLARGTTSEIVPAGVSNVMSSWYYDSLKLEQDRLTQLREYDLMVETMPEISAAMDMYADSTIYGQSEADMYEVTTHSSDEKIKSILGDIEKTSQIREVIWSIARNQVTYGEDFREMIFAQDGSLIRLKYLPQSSIWINVDAYGSPIDPNSYFQQKSDIKRVTAEWPEYQVIHFKMSGNERSPYGRAVLFPIRRVFRQLQLIEDALVIARLTRAHMRYVHKIGMGNLPPSERLKALNQYKLHHMKRRTIDPATGNLKSEDNPLTAEEDFFISDADDLQTIQGDLTLREIRDVEYLQDKIFAGLHVPKLHLAQEQSVGSKSIQAFREVQYARAVRRNQLSLRIGLRKFYRAALLGKKIEPDSVDLDVVFPSLGTIDDLRVWQINLLKVQVARSVRIELAGLLPDEWILKNVFGIDDDQILRFSTGPKTVPDTSKRIGGTEPVALPGEKPTSHQGSSMRGGFMKGTKGLNGPNFTSRVARPGGESIDFSTLVEAMKTDPALEEVRSNIRFLTDWIKERETGREVDTKELLGGDNGT